MTKTIKYPALSEEWIESAIDSGLIASSVFWIDQESAQALLSRNSQKNRSPHDWPSLVRAFCENRWVATPDAIAIDSNGYLFNGQNRLRAFLKANRDGMSDGFYSLVAVGFAPKSVVGTDGGMSRRPHQIARFLGIDELTAKTSTACRRAIQGFDNRAKFGNDEVLEFFQRNRNAVRLVMNNTSMPIKSVQYPEAMCNDLRAVLIRARINRMAASMVEAFCGIVASGITDGSDIQCMVCEYGRTMRLFKGEGGRSEMYALTDIVVHAWHKQEPLYRFPKRLWKAGFEHKRIVAPSTLKFLDCDLSNYQERYPISR